MKQSVSASSSRLASGIQADARFTDPNQKAANSRGEDNGRVGNPCTRFQHQACQSTHRDVRANTGLIDDDKGAVENVDLPPFDEQDGGAVFDWDRAGRRKAGHRGHGGQELPVKKNPRANQDINASRPAGSPRERAVEDAGAVADGMCKSPLFIRLGE